MEDKNLRITDKHVFFWNGWLSNWYPAEFKATVDNTEYTFKNSEQYFMFMKAKHFHDNMVAELIIKNGHDPKEAKRLGRLVHGFNEEEWNKRKFDYMFNANYFKYMQNPKLCKRLLDTAISDKHFVEGSPFDKIWGIGIHYNEASDDESTWQGENLLGKVLDKVRYLITETKARNYEQKRT